MFLEILISNKHFSLKNKYNCNYDDGKKKKKGQ